MVTGDCKSIRSPQDPENIDSRPDRVLMSCLRLDLLCVDSYKLVGRFSIGTTGLAVGVSNSSTRYARRNARDECPWKAGSSITKLSFMLLIDLFSVVRYSAGTFGVDGNVVGGASSEPLR